MPTYKLTSETLTKGMVERKIMATTYANALSLMDSYVDRLDNQPISDIDNLPQVLTFDELLSGDYGECQNYYEVGDRWHFILSSGWFYSGAAEVGQICSATQKLDPHRFHW